ncbi:MAG: preprotein translocase subunit SecG [Clostridiales bacterium]|nr:preprotein translocase subunit SecG [Clostridiales bacterium]
MINPALLLDEATETAAAVAETVSKAKMSFPSIVLTVVVIILAVTMIILFLAQEGNDRGMGIVGGASTNDSYYSRTKGRSLEERLKSATKLVAVLFAVCSVILYILISRGM